jgi:hypothetical protein
VLERSVFEIRKDLVAQGHTPREIVEQLEGAPGPLGLPGAFFADHRKILLALIRYIGREVIDDPGTAPEKGGPAQGWVRSGSRSRPRTST